MPINNLPCKQLHGMPSAATSGPVAECIKYVTPALISRTFTLARCTGQCRRHAVTLRRRRRTHPRCPLAAYLPIGFGDNHPASRRDTHPKALLVAFANGVPFIAASQRRITASGCSFVQSDNTTTCSRSNAGSSDRPPAPLHWRRTPAVPASHVRVVPVGTRVFQLELVIRDPPAEWAACSASALRPLHSAPANRASAIASFPSATGYAHGSAPCPHLEQHRTGDAVVDRQRSYLLARGEIVFSPIVSSCPPRHPTSHAGHNESC